MEVDREVVAEDRGSATAVQRPAWSPAQLISLIVGGIVLAMGAIALSKTGFNFDNLESNRAEVFGLGHTAILALIEIVIGLSLVAAGAIPGAGRGTMIFFGAVMLGFGIVLLGNPSGLSKNLGTEDATGVFYIISGIVLLLGAMLAPTILGRTTSRSARTYDGVSAR